MALPDRVYGGFGPLPGGMNGAISPSLIQPTQVAAARDVTFRDGFVKTRPSFAGRLLTFASNTVKNNFAGIFQGAMFYQADNGSNGLIVSIAGRLFFIALTNNYLVTDITPIVALVTTVVFNVPAVNGSVTVTTNIAFTLTNTTLKIAGGNYTVTAISGDQITLTYTGGMQTTEASGTPVLGSNLQILGITTTAQFTIPAIGSNVNVSLSSVSGLIVNLLTIQVGLFYFGEYTIQTFNGQFANCQYLGACVPFGTAVNNSSNSALSPATSIAYPFLVPAPASNVTVTFNTTTALSPTQSLIINSQSYTVSSVTNSTVAVLTYNHDVILAGATIFKGGLANTTVTTQFNVPAVNSTVAIVVGSSAALLANDVIKINSGNYVVTVVTDLTHITIKFTGYLTSVPTSTNVVSTGGSTLTTTTAAFNIPAVNGVVAIPVASTNPLLNFAVYIDNGYYLVEAISGLTVTLQFQNFVIPVGTPIQDNTGAALSELQANPSFFDFVYGFQAENFAIICAAPNNNIFYDGATSRPATPDELPPSVFGIYSWGRCWMTLQNRRSFMAGDLVYDPSGSAKYGFRDAILETTENKFLNGGGTFTVPADSGSITSMFELATQDTSLGQGNLLVGTDRSVISVNTPVDRTQWQNTNYPIATVALLANGPVGPRFVETINGDSWYRTLDEIRSFIVARREINIWGNTPMSREVSGLLAQDTQSLLFYGSAMLFNNRLYMTISPYRTANGVAHRGLAVMNFDLISSLQQKTEPAWDGIQTGLQFLQILKGQVNGLERGFAFVLNGTAIELWEFLLDGTNDTQLTSSGGVQTIKSAPIPWWIESRSDDHGDSSMLKKIYTAEMFLDQLSDLVTITIKYKPNQEPYWTTWTTFQLCANVSQCSLPSPACTVWQSYRKQYAARIMLPAPGDTVCSPLTGKPTIFGYEFQYRIEVQGSARIRKFRSHAIPQTDTMQGQCPPNVVCNTVIACDTNWFDYDIHNGFGGGGSPPQGIVTTSSSGVILTNMLEGMGAPTKVPAIASIPWIYFDQNTGILYFWDYIAQQWK